MRTNRISGAGIVAIRRGIATLLCGTLGAALAVTAMALPASATPGQLGGLNLAGYCQGLGDHGTTAIGPATLARGAITGPNFAYDNWACVTDSGVLVPITATGPAPSMTNACLTQYPGVASYTYPTDPNDAFTWNCYLLPPSAGTTPTQQEAAALSALTSNDAIQAEITLLQTMPAPPGHVVVAARQFVSSLAMQELIADVLGGYQLSGRQGSVSAHLGNAIFKTVLHQS